MRAGFKQEYILKEEIPLVTEKFTHALCIGQTGSGKTTSFINPNLKSRMIANHGILFFDIKGSEHTSVKKYAHDTRRIDDVIEIGKPWGKNINILNDMNTQKFTLLLKNLVGNPKEGGSNTFFYNEAMALGINIFKALKLQVTIHEDMDKMCHLIDSIEMCRYESIIASRTLTLKSYYRALKNIDSIYDFIQQFKKFNTFTSEFIDDYFSHIYSKYKDTFKSIILNLEELKSLESFFVKYDVVKKDREESSKFESSLLSVISTLSSPFGFMATKSADYICEETSPFDVVDALLNNKIIIINVDVIDDTILEMFLSQIFLQLIKLNTKNSFLSNTQAISIFIDEAHRLISKDLPLDILRSSKVDVIMAIQSETQLVSKFKHIEDWEQLSVNIAQKFAFKSVSLSDKYITTFHEDISMLNTFEYFKEYSKEKRVAIPHFISDKEKYMSEYYYQHNVLKLKNLDYESIYIYDENLLEEHHNIVSFNITTKTSQIKKYILPSQEAMIENYFKYKLNIYEMDFKMRMSQRYPDFPSEVLDTCYHKYNYKTEDDYPNILIALDNSHNEIFNSIYQNAIKRHHHTVIDLIEAYSETGSYSDMSKKILSHSFEQGDDDKTRFLDNGSDYVYELCSLIPSINLDDACNRYLDMESTYMDEMHSIIPFDVTLIGEQSIVVDSTMSKLILIKKLRENGVFVLPDSSEYYKYVMYDLNYKSAFKNESLFAC
jgi:hypothetical protein